MKKRVGPLKENDGKVIIKCKYMAEKLNDYFSSVYTIEDASILPDKNSLLEGTGLGQLYVTTDMIVAKINRAYDERK